MSPPEAPNFAILLGSHLLRLKPIAQDLAYSGGGGSPTSQSRVHLDSLLAPRRKSGALVKVPNERSGRVLLADGLHMARTLRSLNAE